jgi:hypothetical protein
MWDILCHKSTKTPFDPPGEGLFEASFLQPLGEIHQDQLTVETEIFHGSAAAVDMSEGGQALPPYSSTLRNKAASDFPENGPWNHEHALSLDKGSNGGPLEREPLTWAATGLPGDVSFMDVTHDPFFQFQDHENPYQGIWEIGNL